MLKNKYVSRRVAWYSLLMATLFFVLVACGGDSNTTTAKANSNGSTAHADPNSYKAHANPDPDTTETHSAPNTRIDSRCDNHDR